MSWHQPCSRAGKARAPQNGAAEFIPKLVHARKAKLMMGMINKTDTLDARGLNRLQRAGTLPTVWIAPGELRRPCLAELPPQTAYATERLLEQVEGLDHQVHLFEQRMAAVFEPTPEIALLMSLPGVGFILAVVIAFEVGDVGRFASNEKFAAYAGTTPRGHASGGRIRFGPLRPDVNHYLKWAFVEAATVICRHRRRHPTRHVSQLYERVARRKGHQKAIRAVAQHLAEATYWMLTQREPYREPRLPPLRRRRDDSDETGSRG